MCDGCVTYSLKKVRAAFCGLGLKENMPYMLKSVFICSCVLLVVSALRLLFAIHYFAMFNSVNDRAEQFFEETAIAHRPGAGRTVFSISSDHLTVLHTTSNVIISIVILSSINILCYSLSSMIRRKFAIQWKDANTLQLQFIDERDDENEAKRVSMARLPRAEIYFTRIVLFVLCLLIIAQLAMVYLAYVMAGSARSVITHNIDAARDALGNIRELENEWHCKLDCREELIHNNACAMCSRVVRDNVIDLPFFVVAAITLIVEFIAILFVFPRLNAWLLQRKEKAIGMLLPKQSIAGKPSALSPTLSPSPSS